MNEENHKFVFNTLEDDVNQPGMDELKQFIPDWRMWFNDSKISSLVLYSSWSWMNGFDQTKVA